MKRKKRLIIFGTGQGAIDTLEHVDPDKTEIVCFLDSNKEMQGQLFFGRPVVPPEEAAGVDADLVLIGSKSYYHEMMRILLQAGVPGNKIFSLLWERSFNNKAFSRMNRDIYRNNNAYASIIKDEYQHLYYRNYAICQMRLDFETRTKKLYQFEDYLLKGIDYVRLSTVELLAREIHEKQVEGAVAELGVYQGHFTRWLEASFPDRPLYLFDTFEGFQPDDVQIEHDQSFSQATVGHLSDTSVEIVLDKLDNKENVHVIKGYFPESAQLTEDRKYAFVTIDVDLYQPVYEGLKYFYKRLSAGGYIMVHDYNFEHYRGVKQAVRKFCEENGLNAIPVSDFFGSVLLAK